MPAVLKDGRSLAMIVSVATTSKFLSLVQSTKGCTNSSHPLGCHCLFIASSSCLCASVPHAALPISRPVIGCSLTPQSISAMVLVSTSGCFRARWIASLILQVSKKPLGHTLSFSVTLPTTFRPEIHSFLA